MYTPITSGKKERDSSLPSIGNSISGYNMNSYYNKNYDTPPILPRTLNEDTDQFVSALVHEIRNPLTNINLSVQMLMPELNDMPLKKYIDIILRGSIQINTLINELLKYQQMDESRTEVHSIHQLLDEVLEMAKDRISLKNVKVIKQYTALNCDIPLNRPKMRIALTNIIINAIEAMTSGKGELRLVTKAVNSRYIIQIEDNGCGISKQNLQNIFKAYFTTKPSGLGIGLAKTYDILRSNHIKINVESEEGKGTSFILYFDKKSS